MGDLNLPAIHGDFLPRSLTNMDEVMDFLRIPFDNGSIDLAAMRRLKKEMMVSEPFRVKPSQANP